MTTSTVIYPFPDLHPNAIPPMSMWGAQYYTVVFVEGPGYSCTHKVYIFISLKISKGSASKIHAFDPCL